MPTQNARFPYNLPSREALVALIQETKPCWGVQSKTTQFNLLKAYPTANDPGRTFIEVYLTDCGQKKWYWYRRLDIAVTLGSNVVLNLTLPVSPEKIVNELNRQRGLHLNADDVVMTRQPLGITESPYVYRLEMKPGSYVWYGQVDITLDIPIGAIDVEQVIQVNPLDGLYLYPSI